MPKNVMLAVHCKQSDALDMEAPLHQYITSNYGEREAADANEDLVRVNLMRKDVINQTGALPQFRELLAKYYCALSMVETRFPIAKGAGNVEVAFAWQDAFKANKKTEQHNVHYEKAAILFNMGAVASQLGLQADRTTEEGIKEAAKRFQEAAGCFALLRDRDAPRVDAPRPVDVSPECCTMLEKLMLAQAQECFFEKATKDSKSPGIVARIAQHVAVLYEEVHRKLCQPPLNQHFERAWVSHIACKGAMYKLLALQHSATALSSGDDLQGCGKGLARLGEAYDVLATAKRESKQTSRDMQEWVTKTEEGLTIQYNKARRENETVYLQRIPDASTLPAVQAAAMVKSLPPEGLDPSKAEELFRGIVPDTSAKAMSKYTDMVDTLVRTCSDKMTAASDDARLRLREWDLPECLDALSAGSASGLPDALRGELEALDSAGGLTHLMDMATQIRAMRASVESDLTTIEADLDKEAADDEELRQRFGVRWTVPPSLALTKQLRDKVAGYRNNLSVAGESDAKLMERLNSNASMLGGLSMEAASRQLPRLQAPMVPVGDVDPVVLVNTLRQAMDTMQQLSSQRAVLEESLKEEKNKDNILPKLMASADNYEGLFTEEMKKYNTLTQQIDDNIAKQADVLSIIRKNVGVYKETFGYAEWRRSCEASAGGMRAQLATYRELRDNMSEGARFYTALQEAVKNLAQQAGDYCLTRRIQRDDLLADFQRERDATNQMASMSINTRAPPPQYQPPLQQHQGGVPPPAAYAPPPTQQQQQYAPPPTAYHPQQAMPPPPGGVQYHPHHGYQQQYAQAPPSQYGAPPPHQYAPPPQAYQQQGYLQQQQPPPPTGQQAPPPQYHQNPGYGQGGGQQQAAPPATHNPLWGK